MFISRSIIFFNVTHHFSENYITTGKVANEKILRSAVLEYGIPEN